MFETLTAPQPDKIIQLMQMFREDTRDGKVDLGVGVYKTPEGKTPVMKAVKAAEELVWQTQDSKGYVALAGDAGYLAAMKGLLFVDAVPHTRLAAAGTPGGTGAVRQVLEMVKRLTPDATVWISAPTWPNHPAIISYLGLAMREYRYYDAESGGLDRAGMMQDLAGVKKGDLILVHGCCHNPTGVDLTLDDWRALGGLCLSTGAIPFVDMAYLGFGQGIEEDAAGMRLLAAMVPEMLIAASCSKNFGLYRDRVGIAMALCGDDKAAAATGGMLAWLNRQNFAFPPDHGARAVQTILGDPGLTDVWRSELREMREGMQANREALAAELQRITGSDRFAFLAAHRGMFSLLGASLEQVEQLRAEHGIYLVFDSRMNVAGLTPETIPLVAKAVAEVMG
ncbi:aromatic amino acid transaminase [Nioella sediminis]|jgi:aromatic-amino-acid transaminase|uniref:amino acid aminotransferase n=1 Tax=Nioella sediminis TaxID=1912092 RepID=UPI0008FD65BE|nr:amino acid aminotransferase [Nioella sediminis]TBX28257.1 aromatic amino acid aminotransferase [Roseovarius sp. JS7-11]